MPDYAPKTPVRNYSTKPGRQSSIGNESLSLSDEICNAFSKLCHEYLLVNISASVSQTYSIFLADLMKNKNVTKEESHTIYQFYYYYRNMYSSADRVSSQSTKIRRDKDLHNHLQHI